MRSKIPRLHTAQALRRIACSVDSQYFSTHRILLIFLFILVRLGVYLGSVTWQQRLPCRYTTKLVVRLWEYCMNAVADFIAKGTVTKFWLGVIVLLLGLSVLTKLLRILRKGNLRVIVFVGILAGGMGLMGESGYAEDSKKEESTVLPTPGPQPPDPDEKRKCPPSKRLACPHGDKSCQKTCLSSGK